MKLFQVFRKFKYLIAAVAGFPVIGLFAASLTAPSLQPLNYVGMGDLNTFNLSSTSPTPVLYSPWFENGTWIGDLIAYPVSGGGVIGATPDWKARDVFADPAGADADNVSSTYWSAATGTNKRIIITTDGDSITWIGNAPSDVDKLPFRYNDYVTNPAPTPGTVLTQAQQDAITATLADQQSIINFVRGDRSNEGATLRTRGSILGDIIHSAPEYVAAPSQNYTFSGYAAFKASNSARAARVYAGANDGMLHAFDATNGQEVFGYIPSMVIADLAKLAADPYAHTYFVDGELASGDAYGAFPGCAGSCWRTVLVGGLGAGGKGFYALDITTPVTTADTENSAKAKILWEIGAPANGADPDLGYTFSRPTITRLKSGQWVVIAGNGYDSTNGNAVLYIIDIDSGDVVKVEPSGQAVPSASDKNGLSSPTVIDSDFDGNADYVFAGDLNGDLWRFDLTGVSSTPVTVGEVSYYKLYPGSAAQPITAAPDVSRHPDGDFIVFFGTGRGFNATDIADTTVQAIYGIHDQGSAIATPSLVTQTLTAKSYTGTSPATSVRVATNNAVDYTTVDGWKLDLPVGERLFGHLVVRADRVQFTSTNPTLAVYENWLTQLDFLTGGPPQFTVFDLNQDASLNSTDNVDGNGDGDTLDAEDTVVAQLLGDGLTPVQVASQPLIAFKSSGVDTILISSLGMPAAAQPCTIDCGGGFQGGHIDVDTDSPSGGTTAPGNDGLGGSTDAHQHEYDKVHGQVYVDYFSLEPRRGLPRADDPTAIAGAKLNRVTEVGILSGEEFLVLIANADLSPGGMLTIGSNAPVNVKDYQDALIAKIQTGT
ncbi:MAG: pilus assembly protein, partial [Acidiferrobacterales bacterium]